MVRDERGFQREVSRGGFSMDSHSEARLEGGATRLRKAGMACKSRMRNVIYMRLKNFSVFVGMRAKMLKKS